MKDSPVPPEEMRTLVQTCLEKAAHLNYSELLQYARIQGAAEVSKEKRQEDHLRLEDLLRLGELCIEVLQQNEEHHSEVAPDWSQSTDHTTALDVLNGQEDVTMVTTSYSPPHFRMEEI
ncbi:hypothetical protein NHX12_002647 [Muraenolepis orangiensis]|uniref:MUN domain-containing protein n=1 Tax=Muraenolepis orangiensis TaxID=630683 RepID=A0A9Q0DZ77_9TELE|nr:hypothetical protein NHX12_002647 [Muraenolepis orangiensis]